MHQEAGDAPALLLLNRMQGVHGELELAGSPLLQEEDHRRDQHRDHGQGGREVPVHTAFTQVCVVDHHRERGETFAHHHGSAEISEGLHEHHQGRRQDRGHGQGQHHLEQPAHAVGGGLHQRVVDVFERAVHIDEHQGEELQGLHQQNALEAVDVGHLNPQHGLQEIGDDAVAAHQQNPGVGTDEGSGHAAQHGQHEQQLRALELIEGVEVRDGDTQQQ